MRSWKAVCRLLGTNGSSRRLTHARGMASGGRTAEQPPPPQPIPNRPLRGERPRRPKSADISLLSDEAFLDKLKLGPPPPSQRVDLLNPNREGVSDRGYDGDKERVRVAKEEVRKQDEDDNAKGEGSRRATPHIPESADKIFKEMKETGLIPNAVAMLDGLCKDGLVQEAMKLFNSMREKGSFPDVIVYTAVVEGFCKAHKLDDAKRVFQKMQNNGVIPNAFSYCVLIRGLCLSQHHLDDAVDLTLEMLREGHSPNISTFVALVDELCRFKGIGDARSVVSTLTDNGFLLNHKAIAEYIDKNAPLSSDLSEAIFGKKHPRTLF